MRLPLLSAAARAARGIAAGVRAHRGVFWTVALALFVLDLLLPVAVLSLARKPVDFFTFNPWLRRLPEYLLSGQDPPARKLEFLSNMAIAWFSADNPVEGVEWGYVIDVPSLVRLAVTGLLFGAYFAVWVHYRDRVRRCGPGAAASRQAGIAGALTSVLGISTGPCSVAGCGVPVLPVVGLAITGVSADTLRLFAAASRIAAAVVLAAVALAVVWSGWRVGAAEPEGAPSGAAAAARP